jgi:hypothetical protein
VGEAASQGTTNGAGPAEMKNKCSVLSRPSIARSKLFVALADREREATIMIHDKQFALHFARVHVALFPTYW